MLEQQANMFVMQPFNFQDKNDSTNISQKPNLFAQEKLEQKALLQVMQCFKLSKQQGFRENHSKISPSSSGS